MGSGAGSGWWPPPATAPQLGASGRKEQGRGVCTLVWGPVLRLRSGPGGGLEGRAAGGMADSTPPGQVSRVPSEGHTEQAGTDTEPWPSPQHLHALHRRHALGGPAPAQLRAQHPHHAQCHRGHDHLPGRALQVPLLQGEPPAARPPTAPSRDLLCCSRWLKKNQSSFFLHNRLIYGALTTLSCPYRGLSTALVFKLTHNPTESSPSLQHSNVTSRIQG